MSFKLVSGTVYYYLKMTFISSSTCVENGIEEVVFTNAETRGICKSVQVKGSDILSSSSSGAAGQKPLSIFGNGTHRTHPWTVCMSGKEQQLLSW